MGYRIASGLDKDRLPALIARDGTLSADSLRAAMALYDNVAARPEGAEAADIADATGLSAERVRRALSALCAAGYLETDSPGAPAPMPDPPVPTSANRVRRGRGDGRARGGRRLEAAIMDYELDIDELIRAGDANVRGSGTRAGTRDHGAGTANRDPLQGERNQPAAVRFAVWLRFVLEPDELAACDRFALAHTERWKDWIDRFSPAKAAGTEQDLLDEIRRRLEESKDAQGPPLPETRLRQHRSN